MNSVTILIQQMSIKDIFDILIVSLLVYQLLLIIQGTRAVQMLGGLIFLLFLFWMGRFLRLFSLNWILEHFFNSFFIFLLILFQDQIRSALASFGLRKRFFNFSKDSDLEFDIPELVETADSLSKEKTGALIILERAQGLGNYIATGTQLDSLIHSDLLYSIFQTNGPLHDGAIIIGAGKLKAAGCFLPLAKHTEIHRHLGTRHRAALGITENSDCIAITISEETGKINLCLDGQLYPCKSAKILGEKLTHLANGEKIDDVNFDGSKTKDGKYE